jgi:crystallin alpha B
MSLVPLLFRDWWDDLERPSRLLDQHFGLGLRHHELMHPGSLLRTGYIRPWRNITRQDSGSSNIAADKDKFQVSG